MKETKLRSDQVVNRVQPTAQKERIISLDVLRGFAILGILIMNIQSFSMAEAAYLNPSAYGDLNGLNKWIWMLSHIFADQKFMTIFSLLFGAGIILMTSRSEERSGKSLGLFYRRNFWLLIIGLIHAHIIWHGDILVPYALSGFLVYFMRNIRSWWQIVIGILLISVHTLIYVGFGSTIPEWPEESVTSAMEGWSPTPEQIDEEIAAFTGTWPEQFAQRSETALFMETFVYLILFFWRTSGLMLIGMAFYKLGIFSAKRSTAFYRIGLLLGWSIGIPLVIYGMQWNVEAGWPLKSMFIGSQFNYWGSLFVAFGHLSLVMLVVKSGILKGLQRCLAAVGQMALTNYITQSILCTFIFYGFGLGLLGQVERTGQVLIFLGVWLLQLVWSTLWLSKFKFGPLEWMWRSLTYMKRQPMRIE